LVCARIFYADLDSLCCKVISQGAWQPLEHALRFSCALVGSVTPPAHLEEVTKSISGVLVLPASAALSNDRWERHHSIPPFSATCESALSRLLQIKSSKSV
jgi:hypothetical protein